MPCGCDLHAFRVSVWLTPCHEIVFVKITGSLDQLLKGYSNSSGSDTGKYMSQQFAEMQMYSYNRMEIADQLQLARFCNTIPIIKGCIPIIKG